MIFLIVGAALSYVACSVLAYRATYAYFQNEYKTINSAAHSRQDAAVALLIALSGPLGLAVTAFCSRGFKHGFTVRR